MCLQFQIPWHGKTTLSSICGTPGRLFPSHCLGLSSLQANKNLHQTVTDSISFVVAKFESGVAILAVPAGGQTSGTCVGLTTSLKVLESLEHYKTG